MSRAPWLTDVRDELGRCPRDPFAVDKGQCLDALRWLWGTCYDVSFADGWWKASRRDGLGGRITASTPDDLNRAIREDHGLRPVRAP